MKGVIYVRVSTNRQEYDRQLSELDSYAKAHNITVAKIFAEKISGVINNKEGSGLFSMIEFVTEPANGVKFVLVWDLSRLGRNARQILESIELLSSHKICVIMIDSGIRTLDKDGNENPYFKMVITTLSGVAELDRKLIVGRLQSGYKNFRNNGGEVGRKPGVIIKNDDTMLVEHKGAVKDLKKGLSVRNVMKLHDLSCGTTMKIRKILIKKNLLD